MPTKKKSKTRSKKGMCVLSTMSCKRNKKATKHAKECGVSSKGNCVRKDFATYRQKIRDMYGCEMVTSVREQQVQGKQQKPNVQKVELKHCRRYLQDTAPLTKKSDPQCRMNRKLHCVLAKNSKLMPPQLQYWIEEVKEIQQKNESLTWKEAITAASQQREEQRKANFQDTGRKDTDAERRQREANFKVTGIEETDAERRAREKEEQPKKKQTQKKKTKKKKTQKKKTQKKKTKKKQIKKK